MARDTIPAPSDALVAQCRDALELQAAAHGVDTQAPEVSAFLDAHARTLAQLQREVSHLHTQNHPS